MSMLILGEKGLSAWVKRLLDLLFIGGIALFIGLPLLVKWYLGMLYHSTSEQYWFMLPFLYVTGFLALFAVYELRCIFMSLNKRNPFLPCNVRSLKNMAYACFGIAAAYIAKIFLFNSFMTIILTMAFTIMGLFCIILAEVFHQAVVVKEENDLTI